MDIVEKIKKMSSSSGKDSEKKKDLNFLIKVPDKLVVFPKVKNIKDFRTSYPLLEPFSYTHIRWNKSKGRLVYRLKEPVLSEKEKSDYEKVSDSLTEIVDVRLSSVKKIGKAFEYLEDKVKWILNEMEMDITNVSYNKIMYYIYRDFVGLNKILCTTPI